MPVLLASFLLVIFPITTAWAQTQVRVEVRSSAGPVAAARVSIGEAAGVTDASGVALLVVTQMRVRIAVHAEGFASSMQVLTLEPGRPASVQIVLTPHPHHEEEVTVAATRTGGRLDDQPIRVEVLQREEIEEKMLMTPGDIVMMLNEMGGMRVQATSPSLGAASVRVQGMRGRYTRFLSDGLPLFGEQPGGLGLLQIPPMDLAQVEVIKGAASALYGAGAMGGVVNLVSRRPGDQPERELLVNRSTRGGTDAVVWLENPMPGRWGLTLLGGGHWQDVHDADGDGWADLPGYSRLVARPRLFWDDGGGRSFFATTGVTWEERRGGTVAGRNLPQAGPHREQLDTLRLDAGAVGQTLVGGDMVLTARGAASRQRHEHAFGAVDSPAAGALVPGIERDHHRTIFGEVALRGAAGRHTWVAGAAIEHDAYSPRDLPAFAHRFTTPGVFAQDDVSIASWLAVSGSARVDAHSEYGWFFSPRLSALGRAGEWTARLSGGAGFFGPTALTEETEAAGLGRLTIPAPLRAERGRSASLDVTHARGPLSSTVTLFASRVTHPIHVTREGAYTLANAPDPVNNAGVELLGTWREEPVSVTASYAYVRAREGAARADVPLTPRHSAGLVAMLESEDAGRLGLEVYFTGVQRLEANPYRAESRPYVIVGLLAERAFGPLRVFINGENLAGVRQSRWDPLLRPARAADGRWTVDAWAPLEGRTINGGVRLGF
ncbi:MAG: TonB-dependent receptor [Acidobacteria bacterium]|nr:TonB-dependent receptor [Acidobacteriota bacterium]